MSRHARELRLGLATVFVAMAFGLSASAQEVTNIPEGRDDAMALDLGVDSALMVTTVRYSHRFAPGFWPYDILVQGAFTMPMVLPDMKDVRLEGGGRTTLAALGNWRLQVSSELVLHNTSNVAFAATALGLSVEVLPGYQSERWGLMPEIAYEKMFTSHIRSSKLNRELGYAAAKSGWYKNSAGTFHFGLRGGGRAGPVEISGRFGVLLTERMNLRLLPFYAAVGVAYAF